MNGGLWLVNKNVNIKTQYAYFKANFLFQIVYYGKKSIISTNEVVLFFANLASFTIGNGV